MSPRRIWLFVQVVKPHSDGTGLVSVNCPPPPSYCPLPPPLSCITISSLPLSFLYHSLPASISVSPFFPGPLVRLMDDRAGREWQCINYLAASLILIWLSESSGTAEGSLGHILTWTGSVTKKQKEGRSIRTCFLHHAPCSCLWEITSVFLGGGFKVKTLLKVKIFQ